MTAEERPPVERDYHTDELPALPQRDFLIPATRWVEAPDELRRLGADLGHELVAYKRRIGKYLLWRAGPAVDADARYMALDAADLAQRFTFRLFADGTGEGTAPDGTLHTRFRTWKEALLEASGRRPARTRRARPRVVGVTVPEPVPFVTRSTRPIYENPWIRVREDEVEFPDGHVGIYGVVTAHPAVGVLPFLDDDTVLLVRQWRYVIGRATWEMPTGGVKPGEDLEAAVHRELAEETGHRAERLEHVASFDTSKSLLDERAHLYVATGLRPLAASGVPEAHEPEFVSTAPFPFDAVLQMVLDGEIVDAMTIIAMLRADRSRRLR